jgi:hypothetical protein
MLKSEDWCAFYLGDNCVRQKQKEDTNYSFLLMQLYFIHGSICEIQPRNTDLASVMYSYYMHADA